MFNIEKFKGKITYQVIDSLKISNDKTIRIVTIADLHNYTDLKKRSINLARVIKEIQPDIVFIAGDIFNCGKHWLNVKKLASLKYFISLTAEVCPVCLTLGNHDLIGINNENMEKVLTNFYDLNKVKPNFVYPLYNDSVTFNEMVIVGYVPSANLMNDIGLQMQIHGIAHDKFIEDYNKQGIKFKSNKKLTIFLGHDPHLISVSENSIGLGKLSCCDYFITGHLHDGYKSFFGLINKLSKMVTGKELAIFKHDRGLVEQPTGIVDKDGKVIKGSKKILGLTGLCRGIVYFDNEAQQKLWQSPDNTFYINIVKEKNKQKWEVIDSKLARDMIISKKLHGMLISEGISPIFMTSEKSSTINVIDVKGYIQNSDNVM